MKLSLVVLMPGKTQGKRIPITLSQFLIGRDPQCHLRPASPVISNRHCALLVKNGKVFVRDFDSTNGTFVNEERVTGEREIKNEDHLRIGPLAFELRIEGAAGLGKLTPMPPTKSASGHVDDEAAANLLLSLQEDGNLIPGTLGVDSEGVPTGSTVMDIPALSPPEEIAVAEDKKTHEPKAPAVPVKPADTSSAANDLLQKYLRRPRK